MTFFVSRTAALITAIVVLMAVTAHATTLTPQQVERDVALAEETYRRIHPGYTRYTPEATLSAAWADIVTDARGAQGLSVEEFYLRVQRVLALMRCDHTKAELSAAMAKARRTEPVYLPLMFELIDGRALVTGTLEGTPIAAGEELLAIDGQTMTSLIERFSPLIPVDAYTDHVRVLELAQSLEFDGGAIEHFMALEGVSARAMLDIADSDGQRRSVQVERVGLTAQRALLDRSITNFKDAVSLTLRDDKTAILRVDTFVNYRQPVDPDDVYAPIFKQIADANVQHLVVDLRENGGGSNDARDRLAAYLVTERTTIAQEARVKTLNLDGLRDHLSTWDSRALNPKRWWFAKLDDGSYRLRSFIAGRSRVRPARDAFAGRLTVLSSRGNSSGSTMLIGALQNTGRARVVGGATGGNVEGSTAGILFTLTLPESQLRLRVPGQRSITGYTARGKTGGVVPDVMVSADFDARRAGVDVVLKAALDATR